MDLREYAEQDAVGLAALIRAGEITAAEAVDCAGRAAAAVNGHVNAVVETFDDAVKDLDGDAPPSGPFAGVPTMVKDLFHGVPGRVCENGSRLARGWTEPTQAELPRRMRAAGLVPVGRTTTSEFGIMGTTETLQCGRTASPWSTERMAGGSSGGSASVVGAGVVPVASASDGGGSIRIPASACGVVGLKPSRGRVPWGPDVADALVGWAVQFVVTRSVRDAAAFLDEFAGPLPGDPFVIAPPSRPFAQEVGAPVQSLRIATWSDPLSGQAGDDEVAAATTRTARLLEDLGHRVEVARPPLDWEPFLDAMTDVWAADAAQNVDGFARIVGRAVDQETVEGATLAAVEHGREVSAVALLDAVDVAHGVARAMGRFFGGYDVLLTPTLGRLPARLGEYDPTAVTPLRDTFSSWAALESFLPAFNATGQPAISLPLETSRDGLPIGMQFVGAFGAESLLLRLAAQLEQARPWHGRRPPIWAGS